MSIRISSHPLVVRSLIYLRGFSLNFDIDLQIASAVLIPRLAFRLSDYWMLPFNSILWPEFYIGYHYKQACTFVRRIQHRASP